MNELSTGYGTLDIEGARSLARRIFDAYDRDKSGAIESYEIGQMMTDTYKSINKSFVPSQYDIDTYIKVLDKDNDGKVTLSDIEGMVMKLMTTEKA